MADKRITTGMRDVLIEHLDGTAVKLIAPSVTTGPEASALGHKYITTKALLERRLLRTDGLKTPKATLITEAGRAALAEVLADWADALTRAKYEVLPPRSFRQELLEVPLDALT